VLELNESAAGHGEVAYAGAGGGLALMAELRPPPQGSPGPPVGGSLQHTITLGTLTKAAQDEFHPLQAVLRANKLA